MFKMLATLGVVAVGGGLSLCGLCGSPGRAFPNAHPVRVEAVSTTLPTYTAIQRFAGADAAAPVETRTVTFKVDGMTCGGCVFGVRKVLTRLPGVSKADVTYEKSRAVVTYDPAKVSIEQMAAAIATLGYKATVVTSPA